MEQPLLDIRGLRTQFFTDDGLGTCCRRRELLPRKKGNCRGSWGIRLWEECNSPVYFAPYPRPAWENR